VTLELIIADLLLSIDTELQAITYSSHDGLGAYYGMLHYHLGWADEELRPVQNNSSGKRLRPLLCLLSCQALDGDLHQALPAACAIELIHNFSLVHDDIQDGSRTRRGRRTVWDIWGKNQGINVGDGLFVLAHVALHRLSERGVSPNRQQAATLALDRACLALCEGQFFDMAFEEHLDVDLDQYLWMIRSKTAALLAVATQVGAILATDDVHTIKQFARFGENLGMAYQIQDDLLGAWGDEQKTGKSAASDIRDRKKTFPVVYALNQADNIEAARQLSDLYARQTPLDEATVQSVLDILHTVGARQKANETALSYYHRALQSLEQAGLDRSTQSNLRELAASLLGRQA
jgi:geranylgeranyl diphosphate synthase type I